jgi:transcriptional regulator with XRE-family HTH domain
MDSYRAVLKEVAARARRLRLLQNLKQDEVAERAGVGVMTVKRFEQTGRASIENVLRIAHALRADAGFEELFKTPPYESIDEALARPRRLERQRVRSAK